MSRDLLYKPPVPVLETEDSKAKGEAKKGEKAQANVRTPQAMGEAATPTLKTPAYKAAYFNQDISGLKEANQAQRSLKALRGAEGATDLKKITLPPAVGIETPDPAKLRGAIDLMGLEASVALSLQSLMGRQTAWTRAPGMTVEILEARLKQLEQMVTDRKRALDRMTRSPGQAVKTSVTIALAVQSQGEALNSIEEVASSGADLIARTADQAGGMHKRIAKALGVKKT